MAYKVVRLTESDLERIVRAVIKEQSERPLTLPFTKTFKAGYWKLTTDVKTEIDNLMVKVKEFMENNKGSVIKLTVLAGESQIPNVDRERNPPVKVERGYLSEKRFQTISNHLKRTYSELLKNITIESEVEIGDTPYSKEEYKKYCKTSRQSDECKEFFKRYEPEQFIKFVIKVDKDTDDSHPLCNIKMGGDGRQAANEDGFVSILQRRKTNNVPGEFSARFNHYQVPDRSQIFKIDNDGNNTLIADTGYFGTMRRVEFVGALTFHYHKTKKGTMGHAFANTDLHTLNVKKFDRLVEVLAVFKGENVINVYDNITNNKGPQAADMWLERKFSQNWDDRLGNYEDYSPYQLWKKGKREFVIPELHGTKNLKFSVDENTSHIVLRVFGPLSDTKMNVKITC